MVGFQCPASQSHRCCAMTALPQAVPHAASNDLRTAAGLMHVLSRYMYTGASASSMAVVLDLVRYMYSCMVDLELLAAS